MGLLRSIVKFFCFFLRWKLDDDEEEEEEESDPSLHRWRQNQHYTPNAERSPFLYHGRPGKDPIPILPVQNPVPTTFISNEPSSKGKEKLKEEVAIVKSRVVDEGRWTNIESSRLLYPRRPRKDPILPVQNPVPKEEYKEEVMIVKKSVVVDEERRIKHYSSRHRILLVGEGDFSFSASLAVAFGSASNIIATSLNSKAFLKKNYANATSNIEETRSRGGTVMHGIDATEMANHESLRHLKFDRIVFNFPFAGFFSKLSPECQLRCHRRLVSLFLKNAKEMVVSEDGEIHITHKTNAKHAEWKVESIASSHGLKLIEAVKFKHLQYPGYNPKYGFGGDGNFNCYPCKTYKFGLKNNVTPSSSETLV